MVIDRKKLLVYGTLFVGPAGMFYTPIEALGSFRVFYYFCLALNLYAIVRLRHRQLNEIGVLIFILTLMIASAGYGLMAFHPETSGAAQNPVVRALVIGNAMFGFYFLGRMLTELAGEQNIISILDKAFYGFLTVFALGFALYLGVIWHVVPSSVYRHFVSLQQTGYGYLRLSPGTYPNEFGVLCSFFAVYALIKYAYESVRWPLIVALFFLIGMFLASTRAAYVTFFCGVLTLLVLHPSARLKAKLVIFSCLGAFVVIGGLRLIGFDVIHVFVGGYNAAFNMQEGSTATRREAWTAALEFFQLVPGMGIGFESPGASFLHNLPLQLLYGLGIWGFTAMVLLFVLFFAALDKGEGTDAAYENLMSFQQFWMIRLVLLEHFVLFGLTNHNQAHFLTWFLFALYVCNIKRADMLDVTDEEAAEQQSATQTAPASNRGTVVTT